MKMTARGGLAALVSCVAAAVAAPPAMAGAHVPVVVPLEGLEHAVPLEAPTVSSTVPVPVTGTPGAPRFRAGRLLPEGVVPQVPVSSELPRTLVAAPLPDLLGDGGPREARLGTPHAEMTAAGPGADVNAPLTGPTGKYGLPEPALPEVSVLTPMLQGTPGAGFGLL
ncbi:hypothetical protein GCM10020367_49420 [Streptomyces sannanensis]|uniref:Secreted protein n=1 Tax=Streptomyces sannanensis TaxID=285536 RepID=A0ABP6SHJ9_9ACTN